MNSQDTPFPFSFFETHIGLICALMMLGVTYLWWRRGAPIREQYPEREAGYRRILKWFFISTAGWFLAMEFAVITGMWSSVFDLADFENYRFIEWAMMGSVVGLGLLLNYYVFFRGGAEELANHPGYFRTLDENWNKWLFRLNALSVPFSHAGFVYIALKFNEQGIF